jgi:hypothetical protein
VVAPLGRVSGAAISDGPLPPLDLQPDKRDAGSRDARSVRLAETLSAFARLAILETRHTLVSRFMSRGRPTVT